MGMPIELRSKDGETRLIIPGQTITAAVGKDRLDLTSTEAGCEVFTNGVRSPNRTAGDIIETNTGTFLTITSEQLR